MPVMYNAEEIYQIGVEIEKNGESFYRAAVESTDSPDAKDLFEGLADWERGHIALFEELKAGLPPDVKTDDMPDPDEEKARYLKAAADSHVFVQNKDINELVADCEDAVAILKLAMGFEKDSVVVYTSMKDMVPKNYGRDTIDRLIAEEIQHVAMLQQKIEALSGE
ncbi:MAG: hypothetical protein GF418_06480 [Chitinivibrionales bacterium]|nr:hypothetical protein [Chitinivibrionales bacterium]MBD3395256.1 hypothetical protein [Chitinivibrionales bacterium]